MKQYTLTQEQLEANINDRLTFLDNDGMHYSIFADASLEDLSDILN